MISGEIQNFVGLHPAKGDRQESEGLSTEILGVGVKSNTVQIIKHLAKWTTSCTPTRPLTPRYLRFVGMLLLPANTSIGLIVI